MSVCLSVCLSVYRSVSRSVRKMYCGKAVGWMWMPFGVMSGIGRVSVRLNMKTFFVKISGKNSIRTYYEVTNGRLVISSTLGRLASAVLTPTLVWKAQYTKIKFPLQLLQT